MQAKLFPVIIFIIISFLYIYSYSSILKISSESGLGENPTWITRLSPDLLSFIAGEFKGMAASYLTLDAGARIGTKVIRKNDGGYRAVKENINWNTIHKLLTLSQHLDPRFQQTFIIAQGNLPWDANMTMETNQILQTASDSRQWDWQPLHFIAFNTYYFFNNPGKAGKIMLQAGKRQNAPSFLAILGSRLAQKGNETRSAIMLLQSIIGNKSEDDQEYINLRKRLQALEGSLVIEKGVATYHFQHNKFPENVTELVENGILPKLPPNSYNVAYCIDKDGKIYFDNPYCRK